MGIEFELKYKVDPAAQKNVREAFAGTEQTFSMATTYYDTPSGAFSARKCTLRRRMENEKSVCTLKAPTDGLGRREWETECDSIEAAIGLLCKLDAPQDLLALAEEGLLPICGARFTRIAKTLTYGQSVLELAMDTGVLVGADRQIPLCEVEVELKEGSQTDCLAFAHLLEERFGLLPEQYSKFRRALALYRGEEL